MKKRYLVLQNGMTFSGYAFGADAEVTAEVVFNTGVIGYAENVTDRCYTGQAVLATFPLSGNYGVNLEDIHNAAKGAAALIVREHCAEPSNFRCEMTLDSFLRKEGIVGLCGIDTRALTRLLREEGSMNAMICDHPSHADLDAIRAYRIENPVAAVTVKEITALPCNGKYHVAVYDFGHSAEIAEALQQRGCRVTLLPASTTAKEVLHMSPDGILLSAGPGDPADNTAVIAEIRALTKAGIPMMGIGLGHQIIALAHNFTTYKLKYGHHGANHPVRCTESGNIYITSQNHGYAVEAKSINPAIASESFVNVNDKTNEGLRYVGYPICSVQFQPCGNGGARESDFLYDEFITMMEDTKHAAQ